ncbi:hypothetical protein [Sphingorhabdus sp. EL138]|jgi:predicted Kef-type K+ transport protein|uniref:hypothetical protein n=1 Tax=Sphingorhabdus sp. EL138 TaxID=2073156 RepID=UPI000D6980C4|nr:hypothetical protein [Sphingorhabdus sp. EL138]
MTPLTILLIIKIAVSLLTVVTPFVVFSGEKIDAIMNMKSKSTTLYRIYGIAVLALLVGYSGGIYHITQGEFPIGVVFMGIVSNLGATSALLATGAFERNKFHTFFFGSIGIGLVLAILSPDLAMAAF